MQSNIIISEILKIYKELCQTYKTASNFVSNKRGDSFYTIQYRENQLPIQIRISDHGTFLNTWVDRELLSDSKTRLVDPSNSINISIVFIDEGNDLTMDCPGQSDCVQCKIQPCVPQTFNGQDELGRNFAVTQYVYSSKNIAARYIPGITRAIMQAKFRGKYIDPLRNLTRSATTKQLTTNKITKHKQYTNMKQNKQTIKLNESQLREMIKEALNELDWKTYASASEKASDKSDPRWFEFLNKAREQFNKDFGYSDETGDVSLTYGGRKWRAGISDKYGNTDGYPRYFITNENFYGQNGQHEPGKWCVGTVGWAGGVSASPDFETREEAQKYADEHGMHTEVIEPSDKLKNAYDRAKEETEKYNPYDGTQTRYKYDANNGGWHYDDEEKLEESIKRTIRKYLH